MSTPRPTRSIAVCGTTRRVGVSAYPEYDDLPGNTIPTRPADRDAAVASAEWAWPAPWLWARSPSPTLWTNDLAAACTTTRCSRWTRPLNGSDAAPDGNDRSTNYWLGDVPGLRRWKRGRRVTSPCWVRPSPLPPPMVPTTTTNVTSVPRMTGAALASRPPTAVIDFEDLMVFSMNYSVVSPSKQATPISQVIDLAWVQRGRRSLGPAPDRWIGPEGSARACGRRRFPA